MESRRNRKPIVFKFRTINDIYNFSNVLHTGIIMMHVCWQLGLNLIIMIYLNNKYNKFCDIQRLIGVPLSCKNIQFDFEWKNFDLPSS